MCVARQAAGNRKGEQLPSEPCLMKGSPKGPWVLRSTGEHGQLGVLVQDLNGCWRRQGGGLRDLCYDAGFSKFKYASHASNGRLPI